MTSIEQVRLRPRALVRRLALGALAAAIIGLASQPVEAVEADATTADGGGTAAVPAAVDAARPASARARAAKATLAVVVPFLTTEGTDPSRRADIDLLQDTLIRVFVNTGKFEVLDRSTIQAVINESTFATSSLADPANVLQLGKLAGAQYLVIGTVHDLVIQRSTERVPYLEEYTCSQRVRLRIELRLVQTLTGRIVAAHSGDTNEIASLRQAKGCGSGTNRALDKAVSGIASVLVSRTLDVLYPMRVVSMGIDEIVLNRGEGSGLEPGAVVDCFAEGEPIVDRETGDVLGHSESPLGEATISKVERKMSVAKPAGASSIPVNSVCRPARPAPTPAPALAMRGSNRPKVKINW